MKVLIGNFKGPKGDTGGKGDKGNKGDRGEPGQRGSRWTSGTGITGTSTTGVKFPNSGITDAQLSDYYINTSTGNLYECTVTGAADTAEWVYIGSFKGPKGDAGPAGSISDINNQKPTYLEASKLENIESGETVNVTFGKLKKAVSVLISHYMQKATQSIIGHVKLSDSAAITIPGEYALDAIEKNASVEGTLANMISQTNSNFSDYVYPPSYGGDADNIKTNHHGFAFNMSNLPAYYGFLDVSTFNGLYFAPAPNGVVRQIFTEWNTGNTFVRTWQKDTWTIWKKFSFAQDDVSMNGKSTWASIFNELKQSSVYVRSVSYYVPDHPLITPPPNTREAHLALVVAGYNDWRIILDADVYNSRLYWAAFSGDEPDVWHELS